MCHFIFLFSDWSNLFWYIFTQFFYSRLNPVFPHFYSNKILKFFWLHRIWYIYLWKISRFLYSFGFRYLYILLKFIERAVNSPYFLYISFTLEIFSSLSYFINACIFFLMGCIARRSIIFKRELNFFPFF